MNAIYYAIFGPIAQHIIQNSMNILNFMPYSMSSWSGIYEIARTSYDR